jgi:hypothetical protein
MTSPNNSLHRHGIRVNRRLRLSALSPLLAFDCSGSEKHYLGALTLREHVAPRYSRAFAASHTSNNGALYLPYLADLLV